MEFKGKLMNQTRGNGKTPNFGPNFVPFGQSCGPQFFFQVLSVLVVNHYSKLLTYAI